MVSDDSHTLASTSHDGFDEDRVAYAISLALKKLRILIISVVSGDDGDAGVSHDYFGLAFGAHFPNGIGGRANEYEFFFIAIFAELGIFREESVARVDSLGSS